MLSDDKSVSSKRIIGTFLVSVYTGITLGTFLGLDLAAEQVTLLTNMLYVAGALLGLGTFEKLK